MRFINDFDWKKTMQYGWRRILRALVRPFAALRLKFRRLSNPNTLVNTVVTDVQAEVKNAVSKKPESLEEYLQVGRYLSLIHIFPDRAADCGADYEPVCQGQLDSNPGCEGKGP